MGTNYYVEVKACESCGHSPEPIHVGKSSGGWKFLFARHEEFGLTSKASWEKFLKKHDGKLVDEYGRNFSAADLILLIEKKQSERLTGLNCYQICGCSEACQRHNENPSEIIDTAGYRISDGHEFC